MLNVAKKVDGDFQKKVLDDFFHFSLLGNNLEDFESFIFHRVQSFFGGPRIAQFSSGRPRTTTCLLGTLFYLSDRLNQSEL